MPPCRCTVPVGNRIAMTVVVALVGMFASACTFPRPTGVDAMLLAEGPRGAVFLQRAEDGWFRTAHPLELDPVVFRTVFQGVRVQASPTDGATGGRVFSDDDVEFLSPLMSTALSKATKTQVVGFRAMHETDVGQETTGGILYVQGRLLHLTLTHYRARNDRSQQGDVTRNPTGLHAFQVEFSPGAARRSSRNEQPDVTAVSPLVSLVLDYESLITGLDHQSAPVPSRPLRSDKGSVIQQIIEPIFPRSGAPISHDAEAVPGDAGRDVQAPVAEKERELESLKGEVRRLQHRLSEMDSEMQRTKKP
jgi:hypothetical protein